MTRPRRWLAVALVATAPLSAQRTVVVAGPGAEPVNQANPTFVVTVNGAVAADLPMTVRMQVAATSDFSALLADTSVSGTTATITLQRLLPSGTTLYWRAIARGARGDSTLSAITGPRTLLPWVTLLAPNNPNGTTVESRVPTFVWRSPRINAPLRAWEFEVRIIRSVDAFPVLTATLGDTVFTPPIELEANTSYRWTLTARSRSTLDSVRVASAASFVVLPPDAPRATILYQNFPNPFPTATNPSTCIWFDLRTDAQVRLDVRDLRGNLVRQLIPRVGLAGNLSAGRYGRPPAGAGGCDPSFLWDARGDDGRDVPAGVYLIHFRAAGYESIRRAVVVRDR
ncbi:MAG: hypothetical protein K2X99_02860 [Gemmatimonadaceae bacterium]|nr:hypothetical protein [Gemmatimonadaceae bacterium]